MTLATLVLLAVFVSLGRWQWQRGQAKQAVWSEFERNAPARAAGARELATLERFAHVSLSGRFLPRQQFLLDNRSHAGQPGYEVLAPFVLSDGTTILVNRGWVPFTGYRERLPDVALAEAPSRVVTGRTDELPTAGLASGRASPETGPAWPKLTSFPTREELERALDRKLERRVLLLDANVADGYVREWTPPGLAPSRHLSYAIQWWGFATVLLVLYFGLNFRKVP